MSDELDDLIEATRRREKNHQARRHTHDDEDEQIVDQVRGRLRGMTADDVARERAEAAERVRLRRLLDQ